MFQKLTSEKKVLLRFGYIASRNLCVIHCFATFWVLDEISGNDSLLSFSCELLLLVMLLCKNGQTPFMNQWTPDIPWLTLKTRQSPWKSTGCCIFKCIKARPVSRTDLLSNPRPYSDLNLFLYHYFLLASNNTNIYLFKLFIGNTYNFSKEKSNIFRSCS